MKFSSGTVYWKKIGMRFYHKYLLNIYRYIANLLTLFFLWLNCQMTMTINSYTFNMGYSLSDPPSVWATVSRGYRGWGDRVAQSKQIFSLYQSVWSVYRLVHFITELREGEIYLLHLCFHEIRDFVAISEVYMYFASVWGTHVLYFTAMTLVGIKNLKS